jgi:cyclopropane fatty-acyl-phospholipid synthase-like methyltransferase
MPLTAADNYDAELRRLNDRFCAATGIRPTDCVLDIGCGAGQTSRDATRAAVAGKVLGLDVSEQLLERGRVGVPRVRLQVARPLRSPAFRTAALRRFSGCENELFVGITILQ